MLNRRGQNIAEYSILIALVIAAAVAMQTYVKRGIQGRVADAVDWAPAVDLGNATAGGAGTLNFSTGQYEPYYIDNDLVRSSGSNISEDASARGQITRTFAKDTENKTGTENITAAQKRTAN